MAVQILKQTKKSVLAGMLFGVGFLSGFLSGYKYAGENITCEAPPVFLSAGNVSSEDTWAY
ncbi:MAG: hypothetical protein LBB28_05615, partial [Synergistaceae bacterium]|nr:hypothetical protein [Synergistaceae bacterium]